MSSGSARIWRAAGTAVGTVGLIGGMAACTQSGTVGPALAAGATTPSGSSSTPSTTPSSPAGGATATAAPPATATSTGPSDDQLRAALLTADDLGGKYQKPSDLLEYFGDHEYNTHGACPPMDQLAAQITALKQSSVTGWPNAAVSFDYVSQTNSALLFESVNVEGIDRATQFMTETHQEAGCTQPFTVDSTHQSFKMAPLPAPTGTSDDCVALAVTLLGPDGSTPPPQFLWVTARVGPVLITLESDTTVNGQTAPPIDAAMVSAAVKRVRGAGIGA